MSDADLRRIDDHLDALLAATARPERIGGLVLHVSQRVPWPYYARPDEDAAVTATDVARVRARQRELAVPEAFEWVERRCPGLARTLEGAGVEVQRYPLLAAGAADVLPPPCPVALLGPDDERVAAARGVGTVGFAVPGTAVGAEGAAALTAALTERGPQAVAPYREQIRCGRLLVALAEADGGPAAVASAVVSSDTAEVVGVATLPAMRRRGLGAAVTAALAAPLAARGVRHLFLSASDDAVARIYERLGFRRVGTYCQADAGGAGPG